MGFVKSFFSQCARPEGFLGRVMLRFMNFGHAPLTNWGLSLVEIHDGWTMLDIGCGGGATLMEAATVGLSFQDSYYKELQAHYTHMKQLFCDGLRQFGLDFTDPQGAYYVLLDVSKYGVKDDLHFCEWLAEHVGVGAVPGSCFFREDVNHLIRFHFAKRDDTLFPFCQA